jgi:multiple sugar transport system permease protein
MTDRRFGVVLLLPGAGLIALLFAYPIVDTINMSLREYDLFSSGAPYTGLTNFRRLAENPDFWLAFRNALVYAGCAVSLQVVIGVALALLLNLQFVGRSVARGVMLLPYVLPSVASALIWKWIYNDVLGVLNAFLLALGLLDQRIGWLAKPQYAMAAVVAVAVWKNTPFVVLVILARLQTIPGEYYEAAAVDGASAWDRFWQITLPQLRTVLLIVVLLRFLWVFNEFDTIWLLTQGGPLNSTMTLSILAYTRAFVEFKISEGVAVTVVMMLFLAAVSVVYFRLYRVEREVA